MCVRWLGFATLAVCAVIATSGISWADTGSPREVFFTNRALHPADDVAVRIDQIRWLSNQRAEVYGHYRPFCMRPWKAIQFRFVAVGVRKGDLTIHDVYILTTALRPGRRSGLITFIRRPSSEIELRQFRPRPGTDPCFG